MTCGEYGEGKGKMKIEEMVNVGMRMRSSGEWGAGRRKKEEWEISFDTTFTLGVTDLVHG